MEARIKIWQAPRGFAMKMVVPPPRKTKCGIWYSFRRIIYAWHSVSLRRRMWGWNVLRKLSSLILIQETRAVKANIWESVKYTLLNNVAFIMQHKNSSLKKNL